MNNLPFILASGSPRRQEFIASLGIQFKVILPDIDEVELPYEKPSNCVRRLSREKAQNVALQLNDIPSIVLAADTVIAFPSKDQPSNENILSKPLDLFHAREMLKNLRSMPHKVITGVTIIETGSFPIQLTKAVLTTVYMRNYSDQEIEDYIATGDPFDKAGGYAIQDKKFNPVEHIEGSYSNVVGLPIETVVEFLRIIGFSLNIKE